MERLLVEAEALKNKHQSQKLLNKEEKLRESVEHQNQLQHESYQVGAKLRLEQFVEILEKVEVYDPDSKKEEIQADMDSENSEECEDRAYTLDRNYMADLTTRYNKINNEVNAMW